MGEFAAFQARFGSALENAASRASDALTRALAIHRNTSHRAACAALADNFPVVRAMVGDEAFEAAALDFIDAFPPCEPRLCLYGATFHGFLGSYPPFEYHAYLADVAQVEWLVVEALFAADAESRDPASFATIDLDTALRLHPAVRFATLNCPAASLWLAHQAGAAADAIEAVIWQPESVLVTRPRNQIVVAVESPEAIAFIGACANGLPLRLAADAAGESLSDVFARTISTGCFV